MYKENFKFYGTHAERIKVLVGENGSLDTHSKTEKVFFSRVIDFMIEAPLIGYLYSRNEPLNKVTSNGDKNVDKTVFYETIVRYQDAINFNYRLIMLCDKENEPDTNKRIDKAFREKVPSKEDKELFEGYMRGGIDVLYEKIIEDASSDYERFVNLIEFVKDFQEKFNDHISDDEIRQLSR